MTRRWGGKRVKRENLEAAVDPVGGPTTPQKKLPTSQKGPEARGTQWVGEKNRCVQAEGCGDGKRVLEALYKVCRRNPAPEARLH